MAFGADQETMYVVTKYRVGQPTVGYLGIDNPVEICLGIVALATVRFDSIVKLLAFLLGPTVHVISEFRFGFESDDRRVL